MNARLRRIVAVAAVTIISLAVLLVVGYTQLLAYLQGDDFRHKVANSLRTATGAESVEIASNFTINGNRISTDGVSVSRLKKVQVANASRLSAELDRSALFSRKLHVHKLSMEEATLSLKTGSAGNEPPATPIVAKAHKSTKKKKQKKGKSTATIPQATAAAASPFTPKSIELEHIECRDSDLNLLHNGKPYQLLGANITATAAPRIGTNAWLLTAENARLHTPFTCLRDSSVKSATAVYLDNKVDVTECRIMLTPGEMRVKAHYDLAESAWTSDLQVNKGDLHRLLNEDWKKRFSGELYGRMLLTGENGGVATATGSFSIQNGTIEGLPFLSLIPIGNTYPYRSIELEKADCQILFPYNDAKTRNSWLFDKINIRARDGVLLVQGHVLIGSDRRLGGTLTIGLPRSIASMIPLSQEELTNKLFTADGGNEDYLWVNMNLSGTLDHPQEDLSIRIATLAGQSLTQFLKEIPKGSATDLLKVLLQQKPAASPDSTPPSAAPPAPQPANLINEAAKAAGSLLNSIF